MPDDLQPRSPGQLIELLRSKRGWSKRVLAVILSVSDTRLSRWTTGRQRLDAPSALALSEVFDVPADRFMQLQQEYDLALARRSARPDPDRADRAQLFGHLPITAMIKRGWIEAKSVRDVKTVESELVRFFRADSLKEIEFLPHAAKRTHVATEVSPAQLAWLYRAREIASEMIVAPYAPRSGRRAVKLIQTLLQAPTEARKVPRFLADNGIRYVLVESLPGARIDGACFWLDETSPVIAMTLRFDRIDNFWFVLRHEVEHVLRGHGMAPVMLDIDMGPADALKSDSTVAEEERIANEIAADFCVPQDSLRRFIARKDPFFAERDVLGFARTLGVHPGLVAGQLQRHTGNYNRFRKHLVKMRAIVSPSAVVDGWGDVAPVGEQVD